MDAGRGEQPIREARPGIEELRLVEVDQKGGIETYVFARARRRLNSREGRPRSNESSAIAYVASGSKTVRSWAILVVLPTVTCM